MNRENLKLMADHIRKIPQEAFDMERFRDGQVITPECNSIGCSVGHCVELDPNPDAIPRWECGSISFDIWAVNFTGLNSGQSRWCFSGDWMHTDNTPKGAALRIEWLLEHGLPEDWGSQMEGDTPLCYRKSTTT